MQAAGRARPAIPVLRAGSSPERRRGG